MANNKKYTKKDKKILTLITNFCNNECGSREDCPENECVLFNIEQVIIKNEHKESK